MAWPEARGGSYDEDKVWDEETAAWVAADGRGFTAHQNQIVVIGSDPSDSNKRVIYFGATA
jgi:hypothetical protein